LKGIIADSMQDGERDGEMERVKTQLIKDGWMDG